MSPWTALLESLHSALIDELTERHPEPKPTLGMPIRQSSLKAPSSTSELLICETLFEEARGFAILALEPGFLKKMKITAQGLWEAVLKRAGSDSCAGT